MRTPGGLPGLYHSDRGNATRTIRQRVFPNLLESRTAILTSPSKGSGGIWAGRFLPKAEELRVRPRLPYRHKFDGDKLVVYEIDGEAKRKAIERGKAKGTLKDNSAKFTDTTENLARFVSEAGDSLWATKTPGHLERVNLGKNQ